MSVPDFLKAAGSASWTDVATVALSIVGGIFVVWQYYRNSVVSRARAAADEIAAFSSNDTVKLALRLIDWHSGYIPYVDSIGNRSKVFFSDQDFHLALRPHSRSRCEVRGYVEEKDSFRIEMRVNGKECDDVFSPVEQYVRDTFDEFLSRLERIESLISSGVVAKKNFGEYFSYWLHIIGDEKEKDSCLRQFSNDKRDALIEYIKFYQFSGVERFFRRYGRVI